MKFWFSAIYSLNYAESVDISIPTQLYRFNTYFYGATFFDFGPSKLLKHFQMDIVLIRTSSRLSRDVGGVWKSSTLFVFVTVNLQHSSSWAAPEIIPGKNCIQNCSVHEQSYNLHFETVMYAFFPYFSKDFDFGWLIFFFSTSLPVYLLMLFLFFVILHVHLRFPRM